MYLRERLLHDLVKKDDNIEPLRRELANGEDPNRTYFFGHTLLHIAARSVHDNPKIVQELINAGVDVCRLDDQSSSVLHFAVKYGKRKVVDILLQTEILINQKDGWGGTALHYAIKNNASGHPRLDKDLYIVRKLLDHTLINVNETDNDQQTPLVWAINIDHFEIVKMLLNRDARVDTSDTSGRTPLHRALFFRNHRIVVALLLKQASLLNSDEDGHTPLNNIINVQTTEFACKCLKIIAFNYNLKEVLTDIVTPNPQLWKFLCKCWKEIENMTNDIIVNELTVYDFFRKCDAKSGYKDPILQIYKPVVKRLLTGTYPEYLDYILNRMSKSTLHAVLDVYIREKYDNGSCAMDNLAEFLKIIQIGLLFKYLSFEEIFCLIVAFTDKIESDYLLSFHEHDWYLSDLWDVYPNDHFCKKFKKDNDNDN